ncbi:MAG: aminotransferase class I/II-fold pyridoxal phosphate-dependent enzyme [Bernardetiaceae bacterium]|jgi:7-keto-8-aminopelargonate synthetase-like enzyme|nr:aminotransferase class I/II-fold pyridoxal phosphate-dependent enzyme [Bernardetiaceae bacterium]
MIFHLDHQPGRTAHTPQGEYLYFSGTAYLGMPHQPVFRAHLAEGLARYGHNFGASRTGNVRLQVFEQAEAALCEWTGAEAGLLMSSGFLAGQLVAWWLRHHWLAQPGTALRYAPGSHPALWLAPPPPGPEPSQAEWAAQTVAEINQSALDRWMLVTNSVDAIRGQLYHFDWLAQIAPRKQIWLLADDSHGLGLLGELGNGIYPQLPRLPHVQRLVVASLAKAGGLPAGLVLGPAAWIAQLRQLPFFAGASPPPPAYLYAYLQARPVYQQALAQLRANVAQLAARLGPGLPFSHSPGYPVFFTQRNDLYAKLLAAGIIVSSFAYPQADGPTITRIVLNALHTPADLARLATCLLDDKDHFAN